MSAKISTIKNGPLKVENIDLKGSNNSKFTTKDTFFLCRCGESKNKPFCDGTHSKINWKDDKLAGRQPRRVDDYKGKKIVVHDDRGICAHIGFCTDGLPKVFRMKKEPWIDPDQEKKDTVIKQINKCPSGALSYSIDGKLFNVIDRSQEIKVTKDGPFFVVGGPSLNDDDKPASPEHYALCRCGKSKNKPFCDGQHWYTKFRDEGVAEPLKKEAGEYVAVGKESDFKEGKGKLVVVNGKKIAMFKHKGKIGAIDHVCPHQGGPLADGEIKNGYVVCPWHQWEFDPITGKAPPGYDDKADSFDVKVENGTVSVSTKKMVKEVNEEKDDEAKSLEYLREWARGKDDFDKKYERLQQLAKTGKSEVSAMRTLKKFPDWEDVLFKGAQLHKMPLNESEAVNTKTVIGRTAKKPLKISIPFYVSHMSYGALSREAKIALAKGSKKVDTVICSGEGGMLPDERKEADHYIYEVGTAMFNHKDDAIKKADAIEIKIGQAVKPGLGGHLPKEKITGEIAKIRGIKSGEDFISPGRHADINNLQDLQREVKNLRKLTGGKPIGIKFSAGDVENDVLFALKADPDFITIDCRGGATGASLTYIKDNVCMPPIFAIHRARKILDKQKSKVTFCVTGGFRDSSDIAKALAMGADAVALATASMIGIGCQQYRICHTGNCPVGIATQNPQLRERFDIDKSVERFVRLFKATKRELEFYARINGVNDVHKLSIKDIVTLNSEISDHTNIEHV